MFLGSVTRNGQVDHQLGVNFLLQSVGTDEANVGHPVSHDGWEQLVCHGLAVMKSFGWPDSTDVQELV